MLILLPPSETKLRPTRGARLDVDALSFPELSEARDAVRAALEHASSRDDALTVLKAGASLDAEVRANLDLLQAPTTSAAKLYTGVLYDALDYPTLDAGAKRRAHQRVVIMSALYGAVRLTDRLAPYRLSGGVTLPDVGDVARFWGPHLAEPLAAHAGDGVIVDCRSTTYRPLWKPTPELARRWAIIDVPGASHWAKHTRGLVARRLCQVPAPKSVEGLASALGDGFSTSIERVASGNKPWILHVTAR